MGGWGVPENEWSKVPKSLNATETGISSSGQTQQRKHEATVLLYTNALHKRLLFQQKYLTDCSLTKFQQLQGLRSNAMFFFQIFKLGLRNLVDHPSIFG